LITASKQSPTREYKSTKTIAGVDPRSGPVSKPSNKASNPCHPTWKYFGAPVTVASLAQELKRNESMVRSSISLSSFGGTCRTGSVLLVFLKELDQQGVLLTSVRIEGITKRRIVERPKVSIVTRILEQQTELNTNVVIARGEERSGEGLLNVQSPPATGKRWAKNQPT